MTKTQTPQRSAAEEMGLAVQAGPFGAALVQAGHARPDVVGLSADLAKYTDMLAFAATFPERYVEVGMAEQNLVCVAAGLAKAGLTPVASTFAAFLGRRAHDFTIMQVALPKANVKLIAAVPGISATFGPSHTSIDDLAIMRAVPGLTVIDPTDAVEAGEALTVALDIDGPVYLRQPFARPSTLREDFDIPAFALGRAHIVREGADVAIVTAGDRLHEALLAANTLAEDGVSAMVVRASTIKPFDDETIVAVAQRVGRIVTAENHSVIGGLFSATSEVIARHGVTCRITPIGVQDTFPMFGSPDYVAKQLHMHASDITEAALALLKAN